MPDTSDKCDTGELVRRANEGDDSAMSLLIEKITPAATAKAVRFSRGHSRISDEDLVQEGMIGFLEAVRKYNSSRGVPFEAFAATCIENRIKNYISRLSNLGNSAVTQASGLDSAAQIPVRSADPFIVWEEKLSIDTFRTEWLSGFEAKVFSLRYDGLKCAEIAAELGCTVKAVDNAIQRIKKKYILFKSQQ